MMPGSFNGPLLARMLAHVDEQIIPHGGDPIMGQKPSLVVRINADTYDALMKARIKGPNPWDREESVSAVIDRLLTTVRSPKVGNKKGSSKKSRKHSKNQRRR